MPARWEHFAHGADVGVRGIGATREEAFAQAAIALSAIVIDPAGVAAESDVAIACTAGDDRLLLVAWLNAVIYEMAVRRMVFARYAVRIDGKALQARAWGRAIDPARDEPAVEPKGATFTALRVEQEADGSWVAQCVVDV